MEENEIGKCIVDTAVHIHRETGPGLLETVYEIILAHQLRQQGLKVIRQVAIPIEYRGHRFEEGFRAEPEHLLACLAALREIISC